MEPATEERKKWHWLDRPKGPHKVPPHPGGGGGGWTPTHPEILPDPPPPGVGQTLSKTLALQPPSSINCSTASTVGAMSYPCGQPEGTQRTQPAVRQKQPCIQACIQCFLPLHHCLAPLTRHVIALGDHVIRPLRVLGTLTIATRGKLVAKATPPPSHTFSQLLSSMQSSYPQQSEEQNTCRLR